MKLLAYVDAGSRGEWAVSLAVDLAAGLGEKLTLLTTRAVFREDPLVLDRAAERFAEFKSLVIEKKVREGSAREAVVAETVESKPAITVFAPAGRGPLGRMFKGSRLKAILHRAPSTVMVARKPVSGHLQRLLVTVRPGPFAETLLMCAQEIAKAIHGSITVLYVRSGVSIPFPDRRSGAARAASTREAADELLELTRRLGIEAPIRTREGMVIHEILAECQEGHYDLLMLGQHVADRETGDLSKDLAEELALECPIPVLLVRPRLFALRDGSPSTV